jgi:hypothetical protein
LKSLRKERGSARLSFHDIKRGAETDWIWILSDLGGSRRDLATIQQPLPPRADSSNRLHRPSFWKAAWGHFGWWRRGIFLMGNDIFRVRSLLDGGGEA